jgi:CRP/FNR family transcriptional regulator, cyclic AMP receptor protein
MTHEAVMRVLASSDVFGGLEPDQLDRLAHECRVRRYAKGDQVFARGDVGGGMFLLGEGSVALSVISADGGEVTLAVLKPPKTFGELAVIDDGPRAATATARQPSVVVSIPRTEVLRLLREEPDVGAALLSALAAVIRQVDDHATDLVLVDLPGRVAKFLAAAAAAAQPGAPRPGAPVPVDLRLSQTELARLVGGSRQQVNRAIVALEARGAIERVGARIVSVRPDRLEVTG